MSRDLYRKKPVVIEAYQLRDDNGYALADWCAGSYSIQRRALHIPTLEGDMTASEGDWIIKGVKGEFYPCKPDIFEATYEPVVVPPPFSPDPELIGYMEGDQP